MKILTSENAYKSICLVLAVFWFMLTVLSTSVRLLDGRDSLLARYRMFAYKNENERLKAIEPRFYPTIALCETSVPKNEKLLIISFPYNLSLHFLNDETFHIEYYLYPRSVYWYEKKAGDITNAVEFCKSKGFAYCVAYDNAKNPILVKVK